jgi:hypothetical protein
MKVCTKCKVEKELTEFYPIKNKKNQFRCYCKSCCIYLRKEYTKNNKYKIKEYVDKNYLKISEQKKTYYINIKEKRKQYVLDNKEEVSKKRRQYYLNSKSKLTLDEKKYKQQKINKRNKEKKINNPIFKLRGNITTLIGNSIKNNGYKKKSKLNIILGCTFEEFKIHLENQFTEGMSWNNHGKWHLDHIYPVSLAKTEEEVIKLNHYTNFQPLWAIDNIRKSNKI